MRRDILKRLLLLSVVIIIGVQVSTSAQQSNNSAATTNKESQLIDIKANLVYPYKINDTLSVLCLVGEFAAQHNGAVITADSAVRFDNERLECFGDVLINKNTTYAYADEAVYESSTNTASLYAPLIKVVDEDITLYTYNFDFNTLTNTGEYWGGGVTIKLGESEEEEEEESDEVSVSEEGSEGSESSESDESDESDEAIEEESKNSGPSVMESDRGYYFADTKNVVGVEAVEFRSDGYEMRGDSVSYNMELERAYFYQKTNIWSDSDDYLYGDEGIYDKTAELCEIFSNGYLLTVEQEAWSDSIEYFVSRQEAILRNNIQIDDTTNKSMAFADFAQYWGEEEKVLLTRNAAVVNYDSEPGQMIDTLFLRGDSILLISTFVLVDRTVVDSLALDSLMVDSLALDSLITDSLLLNNASLMTIDSLAVDSLAVDSLMTNILEADSLDLDLLNINLPAIDSITINRDMIDSIASSGVLDSLKNEHPDIGEKISEFADRLGFDSIGDIGSVSNTSTSDMNISVDSTFMDGWPTEREVEHGVEHEFTEGTPADTLMMADSVATVKGPTKADLKREERAANLAKKREESRIKEHQRLIDRQHKLQDRIDKKLDKEKSIYSDSIVLVRVESMLRADSINWGFVAVDSLAAMEMDSLSMGDVADSLANMMLGDSLLVAELKDSVYRTIYAYGNVSLYRSDMQMVCDSLVAQSIDSTMQLYVNPIMWSDATQITAEQMNFYTKNGVLDYAEFLENPIMAEEISPSDTLYYNQVNGKTMYAYFENNQIVRNDVDGNVLTIYFMQDEATGIVTTISKIMSGHASFYIENQALTGITYRQNPEYIIAPLEKMPLDVTLYLDGFKWHSDIRPTRNSVFDHTIRRSLRRAKSRLKRPDFPIRAGIDAEREELVESGEWQDRTNGVSAAATEWMKSLGFTPGEPRPADMQF